MRVAIISMCVLAAVARAAPQIAPASGNGAAFEVASIKRTVGSDFQRTGFIPTPGRFVAVSVTAGSLIGFAYRGSFDEMTNLPDWAKSRSETYNVTATFPSGTPPTAMSSMLRRLLVERFRLAVHVEREERDVFLLTRAQPKASLPKGFEPIEEDCTRPREPQAQLPAMPQTEGGAMPPCLSVDNGRTFNAGGITMEALAGWLKPLVGRQVMDRTDLPGSYRAVLRYSRVEPGWPPPSDEYPEIVTAIREQLGLKLTRDVALVNILVVDRFERPTED